MTIALIISTYKRADALRLVLKSVAYQTLLPNEIIIADDGSGDATKKIIDSCSLPLKHVWQKDNGFQVARIRNMAVAQAQSDYLIFIDGDIILHKDFIQNHHQFIQKGFFVQGSRVLLNNRLTHQAIQKERINFSIFTPNLQNRLNTVCNRFLAKVISKEVQHLKGIRTCNFAIFKKDFITVNGFNEAFRSWGLEDSELVVRLKNKGIKRKNLKAGAVCYHLDHGNNYKNTASNQQKYINQQLLQQTIDTNSVWCEKGINLHL